MSNTTIEKEIDMLIELVREFQKINEINTDSIRKDINELKEIASEFRKFYKDWGFVKALMFILWALFGSLFVFGLTTLISKGFAKLFGG